MQRKKVAVPYYNLKSHCHEDTFYFFLETILRARIDLHMETGRFDFDEEVNMYVASLLESMATGRNMFHNKPYLSAFDTDVREYVFQHPGLRNEFIVYKENADFAFISASLFLGNCHKGSYFDRVITSQDSFSRIALYYKLAASALAHLQGNNHTMVQVLLCLSHQIEDMNCIIRKVASDYFNLIERISDGSFYHLEREVQFLIEEDSYEQLLDDFLQKYSLYQNEHDETLKIEIEKLACTLKRINPEFSFDIAQLT